MICSAKISNYFECSKFLSDLFGEFIFSYFCIHQIHQHLTHCFTTCYENHNGVVGVCKITKTTQKTVLLLAPCPLPPAPWDKVPTAWDKVPTAWDNSNKPFHKARLYSLTVLVDYLVPLSEADASIMVRVPVISAFPIICIHHIHHSVFSNYLVIKRLNLGVCGVCKIKTLFHFSLSSYFFPNYLEISFLSCL